MDAEFVRRGAGDVNRILVSTDQGKTWKQAWRNEQTGTKPLTGISLRDAVFGKWRGPGNYLVKIELVGREDPAAAGLNRLTLTHVLVNNIHALPYLASGKNTVRVSAAKGAEIGPNRLFVSYCWWEQGIPGRDHVVEQEVTKLPFEFTLDVKTKKRPRMRHVTVRMVPPKKREER